MYSEERDGERGVRENEQLTEMGAMTSTEGNTLVVMTTGGVNLFLQLFVDDDAVYGSSSDNEVDVDVGGPASAE